MKLCLLLILVSLISAYTNAATRKRGIKTTKRTITTTKRKIATTKPTTRQTTTTKKPTTTKPTTTKPTTIKPTTTKPTTTKPTNTTSLSPGSCPSGFVGDNCEIECGVTYFEQNVKIVGGVVANPNRFYI